MFTGDHVLFDITPNITAWAYVRDSLGDYLNSLKAVSKYPVEFAFPGHRKPGNFHVRIRQLLQHHQTRLAEVEELVRQEPGSTVYEIAGQMSWNIQAGNWAEIPLQQKIFAMGECMSHLEYLVCRERIKCIKDGTVGRYFPKNYHLAKHER